MWVRMQLKIEWSDLLSGAWNCLFPPDRATLENRLTQLWAPQGDALACFSVRSSLDLLLQSLDWQAGEEILFSALNVKGMVNIVKRHGLVPVPIDLDFDDMAPRLDLIEQAITDKTRAILVAHLFGALYDLDPLIEIARRHNLMVIEDCAQCFDGLGYTGHQAADVAMFSFGPLKTATALGGALVRVKDPEIRHKMQRIQSAYPVQSHRVYFVRILKFAALKIATTRLVMGLIYKIFALFNKDYEDAFGNSVRGVAKLGSAAKLRFQPNSALLAMIMRRLTKWKDGALEARTRTAKKLLNYLGDRVPVPAKQNSVHTYWAFSIVVREPKPLIRTLRRAGFDAANLPKSQAVEPPADRPELLPAVARDTLQHLVVLPCHPGMPDAALECQAKIINCFLEK